MKNILIALVVITLLVVAFSSKKTINTPGGQKKVSVIRIGKGRE